MFKLATLTEIRISLRKYVMRYPIVNKISQIILATSFGIAILAYQDIRSMHHNYLTMILLSLTIIAFAFDINTDTQYSFLVQFNHNVHLLIDDKYIEEESLQEAYATYRQLDMIILMRRLSKIANICILVIYVGLFILGRGVDIL